MQSLETPICKACHQEADTQESVEGLCRYCFLGKVPFSECAMHMQIAGLPITNYEIVNPRWAKVQVEGKDGWYEGLWGEVLSWPIRRAEGEI